MLPILSGDFFKKPEVKAVQSHRLPGDQFSGSAGWKPHIRVQVLRYNIFIILAHECGIAQPDTGHFFS